MLVRSMLLRARPASSEALVVLTALLITATGNFAFFSRVWQTYADAGGPLAPLLTLPLTVWAATTIVLSVLCIGRLTRPLLVVVLLCSALAAHFMDAYGVVLDADMLRNALQTNIDEAGDLFDLRLLGYLLLLGVLPAYGLLRHEIAPRCWRDALLARGRLLAVALACLVVPALLFGSFYASFLRQHKALRSYANPTYYIYALTRLVSELRVSGAHPLQPVGRDARIPPEDTDRDLVILAVGETARADHFGLNGYVRDTTPRLRAAGAINLPDFWACGTSTAASLPCMFDAEGKGGGRHENLLDVLQHAGVNVVWFDNNSDSKGVALRADYQSFKHPATNPVCDTECRDVGMLAAVQRYIDAHPTGDIFIVLHQMGNHGPAYYKRYPEEFGTFQPACRENDLSRCTQAEIINAYDNALLYTDHFLGEAIELLRRNSSAFEAALIYASDHGESLGEGGIYLHGLPKAVAPDAQLHIPAVLWFANSFDRADRPAITRRALARHSHDNLFHTVLGMFEIETAAYRRELDLLGEPLPHK